MRVLITGITSFLGRAISNEMLKRGIVVYGIVRETSKNAKDLDKRINIIYADLDNIEKLDIDKIGNIDVLIHLAWDGIGSKGRMDKQVQARNILNTLKIVELVSKLGCKRVLFSGSQAEYGLTYEKAKHLKDLEIDFNTENVLNIYKNESLSSEIGLNVFEIETNKNKYFAKNIIISTGTVPKSLNIPGEQEYYGKGVSYCATCDGMLYKKKDVAVVGGGNTALESITVLSEICNNVYVFVRRNKFRGEQIVVDNILKKENVHIIYNTSLTEIKGDENFVTEITTTNGNYNVDGVFITIGTNPNSELFKDLVSLNEFNEIITNHQTMETSFKNIYAIGDVRDTKIRQILTGMSDAIYAIHDILSNNSKLS